MFVLLSISITSRAKAVLPRVAQLKRATAVEMNKEWQSYMEAIANGIRRFGSQTVTKSNCGASSEVSIFSVAEG